MSSHRYVFHVPSRQVNRAAQRGVALLELMVAAAVAVLLAAWGAGYWVDRAESVRSAAVGAWLGEVGKAISQMLEDEFAGLADPLVSLKHRYANRLAPTIAELKQSGYLPAAFPEQSAWGWGQTYGYGAREVVLTRLGACCRPWPTCRWRLPARLST